MDVQMGYDQLRLTPGAWLDLLGGVWRWTGSYRRRAPYSEPYAALALPGQNPSRAKHSCSSVVAHSVDSPRSPTLGGSRCRDLALSSEWFHRSPTYHAPTVEVSPVDKASRCSTGVGIW